MTQRGCVVRSERGVERIDEQLGRRVASLSVGAQRWLKTALLAIRTTEEISAGAEEEWDGGVETERPAPAEAGPEETPPSEEVAKVEAEDEPPRGGADLEDVISGKVKLDDALADFPELADEMEGLADIIDMLREAGERRRRRGEEILREEILGDEPEQEEGEESGA